MISYNRYVKHFINIISLRSNFNQKNYQNVRCFSTVKDLPFKDFRKKTEHFSFNTVKHNDDAADIFGTLTNNVEINDKLSSLPAEDDDIIQYDKDEQHKRLHISEYHKLIQELIKQHKV